MRDSRAEASPEPVAEAAGSAMERNTVLWLTNISHAVTQHHG